MPRPPFLVQVLFHPESKGALELARRIHRELNDDSLVPGLRVPTRFGGYTEASVPASGGSRRQPPAAPTWDDAERCFVVVLADNQLNDDEAWCGFVADVWLACRASGGKHRCVPVQLDADAWPLDQRLNRVNFVRGIGQRDAATRDAFVVRRLLIEMCRHLGGLEPGDPDGRAPVSLFLSHAKADLGCEPKAAEAMVQYLKADQPVEAWVDSGDIGAGSEFSDAIGKGVQRTTVLVILTDRYAT
ncbi:MAG: toll/interleukin-1 receptor domain-containing protein, partial [Verrucomicrobiales bacterium]|nr:toll/interleukin-1 receptor domain-containing protein [Verrucomicrobiales bacterium]